MDTTGLQQLRELEARCELCRNNKAEAGIDVRVFGLHDILPIKDQSILACGECATLGYQNIQDALERTVTQQKQVMA